MIFSIISRVDNFKIVNTKFRRELICLICNKLSVPFHQTHNCLSRVK